MTKLVLVAVFSLLLVALAFQHALARGGSSRGSRSSSGSTSVGPGTGSNTESHGVRGYIRKGGTYVAPHRQSNPDKNFKNNWSTKPNTNPYTGKEGTRTEPSSN